VPTISFKRATAINQEADSLVLTITFRDGDGDLGISGQDTTAEYNYFIEAERNWTVNSDRSYCRSSRRGSAVRSTAVFPILKPDGQPGPIEGDLDYTVGLIEPPDLTNEFVHHALRHPAIQCLHCGRANHRSNQVTSSEIVVLKR
jgi:hypothetical protein